MNTKLLDIFVSINTVIKTTPKSLNYRILTFNPNIGIK